MTYQQVLWAINDAAELAAESAFDAFGGDPTEIPPPETAWDFIDEQLYAEGEVQRPSALPEIMPR
jgi:hypothetical protein